MKDSISLDPMCGPMTGERELARTRAVRVGASLTHAGGVPKPLTPSELAAFYTVSINTVYYWSSQSAFPKIKAGRHLRFDLGAVQRFFEEVGAIDDKYCQKSDLPLKAGRSKSSLKTKDPNHARLRRQE